MTSPQTGAKLLLQALQRQQVDTLFGYPGGAIMPVYDALYDSPIRHILTRHEQGAGLAAIGYARAAGKVGVCLATSGPGATNLVTALADAYLDSVPLVAITGQVATPLLGTDAFQEVDILGITLPIVKHSFLVRDVAQLAAIVEQAFAIARGGRPGPVLIDLPKDVAQATAPELPPQIAPAGASLVPVPVPMPVPACTAAALARAQDLLRQARRPIVYMGGGIVAAGAIEATRRFVEGSQIPAVSTLKGLGVLPTHHPWLLGMLGMHGNAAANLAVHACDLLICVGARFDDRATGHLASFAPEAQVIHLDIDAAEVGKLRAVEAPMVGDIRAALDGLTMPLQIDAWRQTCGASKTRHSWRYDAPGDLIYAPALIAELTATCDSQTMFTTDVGQHQMWVAQHAHLQSPKQWHTSGGLGTMGFGLPAAVGAQLAQPNATVINFTGDGSLMMNVQELATIKRYALPIRIILFDNQKLGMVRQWQELFFEARYSATDLSDNPDFLCLARAFGIPGETIGARHEVAAALQRVRTAAGPYLLHVRIDPAANVWPLVPPGRSNATMLDGSP